MHFNQLESQPRYVRSAFGTMAFVLILLCHPLSASAAPAVEESVVKINVTRRDPDFSRPWTRSQPRRMVGSGVVISDSRILTNAHVVMYASDVLVQLHKSGEQLPAEVTAIAPGLDLAILELAQPEALDGIPPLFLADELPELKSSISVYGYPTGGNDLSVTNGIVSRIEYARYHFETGGLRIQVDAALNPGNSGGPAIQDGKIAGLVFNEIREAEKIGYVIPAEEIQMFLSDISDGHYEGNPLLFDVCHTAENDSLRGFLQLPDQVTGIVVTVPYRPEDDYPLKKWDVITHVGQHAIDRQGYVKVPDGLRLYYMYYVPKVQSDGAVELTIWRDGRSQVVSVPVAPARQLAIPALKGQYPDYFIYGSLVFTTVTQELVHKLDSKWKDYLTAVDSPILKRRYDLPKEESEQLVIIAPQVFVHPITKGYENRILAVIEKLNGVTVKNLRHLAELLRDSTDEFVRFEMADHNESLVFRRQELAEVTKDILNDEGIRYQASKGLRDVFPGD